MSSSKTPCAACKLQRRKCTQECVFAPYFPPDNPRKFSNVQQVFGASNVSKLLTELNVAHREEAVRSLAYEAEARLRDPVYGCVGLISVLQQRLRHVQNEVDKAKKELATYIGPQALQPMVPVLDPHHGMVPLHPNHQGNVYGPSVFPYNNMPPQAMAARGGQLVIREPQQQHRDEQQMLGSQLATDMEVRQVQELFGIYDQQQQPPTTQQQQKDFMSYGGGGGAEMGSVSGSGFNQPPEMSPSLALNTYDNTYRSVQLQQSQGGDQQHHHHQPPRHHLQEQMLLPPQQPHSHFYRRSNCNRSLRPISFRRSSINITVISFRSSCFYGHNNRNRIRISINIISLRTISFRSSCFYSRINIKSNRRTRMVGASVLLDFPVLQILRLRQYRPTFLTLFLPDDFAEMMFPEIYGQILRTCDPA
ncbi:LOB domain-containing protein 36-like [Neltuma alba]|uniref:LOB domain-containing protein 36-like n=1 Tax=Neltuma alba TaxID=207710 RepID=UPI0010A5886A|nr:LOB domain-containing protein 36-like [Prosopis alba]